MNIRTNLNSAACRTARSGGPEHGRRARGAVMIVTLWIVLGISALVLIFARSVAVELFASANQVSALQADAVAKGALQYALAQLDGAGGVIPDPTEFPCAAVSVGAGYFWILRPPGDNETGYCFGLVDEASKLNINSATEDMLINLPNMTADIADSIVNWRSPAGGTSAQSQGADSAYYLSLPDPYDCKHSPFETVEELLLVEGVTPQLLYGDDTNRNGVLDPNEFNSTLGVSGANVAAATAVNGGWNTMVTCYSSEPAGSTPSPAPRARATPAKVGMINVNTAQQAVLECLPGLEQGDVNALTAYRSNTGADLSSINWVAQAIPRLQRNNTLANYITVHSYQFSADIVAVSGDGRAFRRYLAIVDGSVSPPSVLYWKDLTYLGWPLDPSILTSLRSGNGLAGAASGTTGGAQ